MDPAGLLPLWAEAGGLGVIIVSFVMGWIVSNRTHEREVSRADRTEEELRRLNGYITEELVPQFVRGTVALEEARERLRYQADGGSNDRLSRDRT